MKNLPNIRRIDTGGTHGWQFHYGRGETLTTQLFSDSLHGGKRRARDAAIRWRDQYFKTKDGPRRVLAHTKSSRGLGIPGVTKARSGNYVRIRAEVTYPTGKKRRSWNVDEYGLDNAIRLATNWRKHHLKKAQREQRHAEQV